MIVHLYGVMVRKASRADRSGPGSLRPAGAPSQGGDMSVFCMRAGAEEAPVSDPPSGRGALPQGFCRGMALSAVMWSLLGLATRVGIG